MMNMLPNSEPFRPHPNFDSGINSAICQSEMEGGVSLNELPVNALLEVETKHHRYQIENRGDGEVMISGHPEYCPEPVLVQLNGSTWGTPMIKVRFIGRGMGMEFHHPTRGIIRTSRVQEIRELTPAPEAERLFASKPC